VTKLLVVLIFSTKANKNKNIKDDDRTDELKPRNVVKKELPDTSLT